MKDAVAATLSQVLIGSVGRPGAGAIVRVRPGGLRSDEVTCGRPTATLRKNEANLSL
jgi:hypothetical protein